MKPAAWKIKANAVIAKVCLAAYREANPKSGKRHRPYRVPELADQLVKCLATDNEILAKSLFLSYDGLKAIS